MYNNLWSQVGFYQDVARLRRDVESLLAQMASLKPNVGSFNSNGRQVTLFYLYGTIPIWFSGNQYNIPVTVYFDPPYPTQGPRCFVTPTPTMKIKPRHKHVDQRGMIYLPYLSSWNQHTSSLTELTTMISSTFSSDPPVYAVSQSEAQQQPSPPPQPEPVSRPPVQAAPVKSRLDTLKEDIKQKVRSRWQTVLEPKVKEMDELLDTQEKLEQRELIVTQQMQIIESETERMESDVVTLKKTQGQAEETIKREKGRPFVASEFVQGADPRSRQLIDVTAQASAFDDLIDSLADAFHNKAIGLDDFLDSVRETAKEQFFCRKLKEKATLAAKQAPPGGASGTGGGGSLGNSQTGGGGYTSAYRI
uniref:UEV domain-containing protein n=1 Tax=Chromera velia CCMP2878 TaxID=1169474 RepID=A0A0G4FG61_9ALVE|eukprot:Cvel_16845.t1-p1 / transcript=Cvel_16845.t1 / gene=Cvel_16845 / organism=Chromera_velia_CCMP2878 / gene_product=Protein ELC-like, putative / transcript_product=Protein ELC-like, putative / location=Cvel_scaffold1317:22991-28944(-) / protein_length=361 / sequence_SO=supercontig / SO=protein_coding / is_pseudo=false